MRYVLALLVVMAMAVPAFANNDVTQIGSDNINVQGGNNTIGGTSVGGGITNTATASATGGAGGAGGSATVGDITNTQSQGQKQKQGQIQSQGQVQGQDQGQSQFGYVNIQTPQNLLSSPSQGVPELNFGHGRLSDATNQLPNFALFGITKLTKESIREVLDVDANVKFKNLYKRVIANGKKIADGQSTADIRYQIIRAEAQKTWTTGGNLGGAASGLSASGQGGGAAAGSVIPQWGGTKADDLFTIIFVRVIP